VYLQNLEKNFDLIYKEKSINSKNTTKKIRYKIKDNFFDFWFRYVYKKQELIEL
jgi:AAA+ ATPase superfamily predicted ATPase